VFPTGPIAVLPPAAPGAGPIATGAIFDPAAGFHATAFGFTIGGTVAFAFASDCCGMPATFGSGPTNGRAPTSGRGGGVYGVVDATRLGPTAPPTTTVDGCALKNWCAGQKTYGLVW